MGQDFLNPEDGNDKLSETCVRNYHYSLRNKPDERGSHCKTDM